MDTATKIITHPVAVVAFNAINIIAGMAPVPGGDTIPGLVLQVQARLQEAKWRKVPACHDAAVTIFSSVYRRIAQICRNTLASSRRRSIGSSYRWMRPTSAVLPVRS